jgi:hypothetical protein
VLQYESQVPSKGARGKKTTTGKTTAAILDKSIWIIILNIYRY